MASLPNKTFICNYNARDYNPTTRTIQRTSGQTLAQDMEFKMSTSSRYTGASSAITQYTDHISFSAGTYSQFSFANGSSNPFNVTSTNNNLTVVIKYYRNKNWTDPVYPSSPGVDVIMNRSSSDNTINWFMRCSDDSNGKRLQFNGNNTNYISWSNYPVIEAVRMSGLTTTIMNFTDSITGTPFTFSLKTSASNSTRITFLGQNYNANSATDVVGCIGGDFYWVYITREVLTDAEIQQVIKFNESNFGPDEESADVPYSGGTVSVNLSAEGVSWTASTVNNWITISPTTGTGDSVITLTVKKNSFSERTGIVTFTSGAGDEAEFTINQGGTDGLLPYNKIYRNDRRIN